MTNPDIAACFHEAGHIATFRGLLDARVKHVTFFPHGGARTRLLVPVDRDGDRWGRALCVLAVRPQRCGLSAANIVANAKPISTNAGQVLARLNLTVEKAWPHALDLVNRRRQPIARIACHLSRFGTVDETALSALL